MFNCTVTFTSNTGKRNGWTIRDAKVSLEKDDRNCPFLVAESVAIGHSVPIKDLKKLLSGKDGRFSFLLLFC
jgi:hypothetical protein